MKKFSKLITEAKKIKSVDIKVSKFFNEVDWDEIYKPLIDHMLSNSGINNGSTGEVLFPDKIIEKLSLFIRDVEECYAEYYINNVDEGTTKSFLDFFEINDKEDRIMDCIDSLNDKAGEFDVETDWDNGSLCISLLHFKYKPDEFSDFIEDFTDVCNKLQMINADFRISIDTLSRTIIVRKDTTNVGEYLTNEWLDSWGKNDTDISRLRRIFIYVYNKSTTLSEDFKK